MFVAGSMHEITSQRLMNLMTPIAASAIAANSITKVFVVHSLELLLFRFWWFDIFLRDLPNRFDEGSPFQHFVAPVAMKSDLWIG